MQMRAVPEESWSEDHIVLLDHATWADYERLLRMRGDHSAPRIQYLDGTVEIMSPSDFHEGINAVIGRLVEAWCEANGVEFSPFGSWTIKKKSERRGAEPDECYLIGDYKRRPKRPDFAIEVIWTSGGLDKLEIYRKLGVREVWIWEDARLTAYGLRGRRYEKLAKSEVLQGIDLAQLASFVTLSKAASRVVRAYRAALGRRLPARRRPAASRRRSRR